jgi:pimeloyl-ACP methyl ester carboxylesterase
MIPILYLHGFASGPHSRKATFFRDELSREGFQMLAPDLAEGDFRNLTITRQLQVIEREAKGEPVFLIGSSLGGYLAALYAARHPEVAGLVLLAPAFDFYSLWTSALGPQRLEDWRRTGEMSVYHYGEGRDVPLGFQLIEDAEKYEPFPDVAQPCLIIHGESDTVVPIKSSEQFAKRHSNAKLLRLQSGHELTDVLRTIWAESWPGVRQAVGQ